MARHARNSNGFSLIELMVAIVFIMISMLALLSATVTTIQTNAKNELRNSAIRITNQTAETLLSLPINDTDLADTQPSTPTLHTRVSGSSDQDKKGFPPTEMTIRGYRQTYTIQWEVEDKTPIVKEITITVSYQHRGQTYSNTAVIYKHRAV